MSDKKKLNRNKQRKAIKRSGPTALEEAFAKAGIKPEARKKAPEHKVKVRPSHKPGKGKQQISSSKSRKKKKRHIKPEVKYDSSGRVVIPIAPTAKKKGSVIRERTEKSEVRDTTIQITNDTDISPVIQTSTQSYQFFPGKHSESQSELVSEEDEIDLVIGLDFGTAFTKVIVQEPDSERAWAVPFTTDSSNPYLLPSHVYLYNNLFGLQKEGETQANLKLVLLQKSPETSHYLNAAAYLALVIRHAMQWTLQNKSDEFAGMTPYWSVNIGIAAENLENQDLVERFRKLLWCGLLLAKDHVSDVTIDRVASTLQMIDKAQASGEDAVELSDSVTVYQDQAGVYPEIAAQIFGYIRSDRWDRRLPKFMLVDIGGGTVDASIFNVTVTGDHEYQFNFFSSMVEPLGASLLHKARLNWLRGHLSPCKAASRIDATLMKLEQSYTSCELIPDRINDYLENAKFPKDTVDKAFYRKYSEKLWRDLICVVKQQIDPKSVQWRSLPFLLCGGGRNVELYRKLVKALNRSSSTEVKLHELVMEKPDNLSAPSLSTEDYQRLSVAYGLSFLNIGKILTPDTIAEKLRVRTKANDYQSQYIDKDMM